MTVQNGAFTRTYSFGPGDDKIMPRFFIESVKDELASQREGRPIFKDQERVELIMAGNPYNSPVQIVTDEQRQRWPRQYEAFRAGQDMAVNGTPLEQWPILSRSQVLELKGMNFLTVEQVAEMNDQATQRMMGGMRLRTLAKAYLDEAEAGALLAKTTADNDRKDAQIAELTEKVTQLSELLNRVHGEMLTLKNAPSPIATFVPASADPFAQNLPQPQVGSSSLDSLNNLPIRRKGRPPLPRDAEGNVIRESA